MSISVIARIASASNILAAIIFAVGYYKLVKVKQMTGLIAEPFWRGPTESLLLRRRMWEQC